MQNDTVASSVSTPPVVAASLGTSVDEDLRDALCTDHGFFAGGDGLPYPLTDSATAFDLQWKRQRRVVVSQRASTSAPVISTSTLLKLSLAAAVPSAANAFVAESISHSAPWFTVGSMLMGVSMLLALSKMHDCLNV
jgi:hypothetical protein